MFAKQIAMSASLVVWLFGTPALAQAEEEGADDREGEVRVLTGTFQIGVGASTDERFRPSDWSILRPGSRATRSRTHARKT
jgi:hypothetical protein